MHALLLWGSLIQVLWCNRCLEIALPIHLHHYWERALVVKGAESLFEEESEGESWMMTVLEWLSYGELKVLGVAWPFLAVSCALWQKFVGARLTLVHGIVV